MSYKLILCFIRALYYTILLWLSFLFIATINFTAQHAEDTQNSYIIANLNACLHRINEIYIYVIYIILINLQV